MRATRIECPACGWRPHPALNQRQLEVLIGRGDRPRIVIYDRTLVPAHAMNDDAEQVYAWARTGWQGVWHACVATREQMELRAVPRGMTPRAWLITFANVLLIGAALLTVLFRVLPPALAIVGLLLGGAAFASVLGEMDLDPSDASGVEVWRRDRRNRFR